MSAIWNSYSKSLTARSPRTTIEAPTFRAKSTSRPSKDSKRDPRLVADRGAKHVQPLLHRKERLLGDGLIATATMTRSASARLRRIRSSWPFVGGSNEPG